MDEDPNRNSSRDTVRDITSDDDDVVEITNAAESNLTGHRILGLAVAIRGNQQLVEPTTVRQALNGPDAEKWRAAMAAEVAALLRRGTWKLVAQRHTKGRNILIGKWGFKINTLADGAIDKYKARWVVRGFEQTQFVDYDKTFAPAGHHTSVRILIYIAAMKQCPLCQIDVSSVFLHTIVDAIIYVEQPHAFEEESNAYLHTVLIELGFLQLPHDQGMYHLKSRGSFILLIAYVDDLLYTRDNVEFLDRFENNIKQKLKVMVNHNVTQFLGLNVTQSADTIHMSAAKYVETLAKNFGITPISITTPLGIPPPNHEPDATPLSAADHRLYQQQLGCLLFATVTCRPDLSYTVSQLAQYLRRPEGENMAELRCPLQFFISTPDVGLTYKANLAATPQFTAYVDADHAGDTDNRSTEEVGAASASAKRRNSKGKGGRGGGGGSGSGGGGSGGSGGGGSGGSGGGSRGVGGGGGGSGGSGGSGSGGSGGGRTGAQRGGTGGGQRQRQQRRSESPSPQQLREWLFL
ncbi:unnamed protein product [Closterium sp. NIES-53]